MYMGCHLIHRKVGNGRTFDRTWTEFKAGFGDANDDFYWTGNDRIHDLTTAGYRRLEINMITTTATVNLLHMDTSGSMV